VEGLEKRFPLIIFRAFYRILAPLISDYLLMSFTRGVEESTGTLSVHFSQNLLKISEVLNFESRKFFNILSLFKESIK